MIDCNLIEGFYTYILSNIQTHSYKFLSFIPCNNFTQIGKLHASDLRCRADYQI